MFKIDYKILTQLQELKLEKEKIEEKEKELSKALLTDTSLIPMLYEWYKEIQQEKIGGKKMGSRKFKKQFVFLILYLYSPETLTGVEQITPGVRPILTKILQFKSPGSVSNLCSDLLFMYGNYKDFRWEINLLYTYLLEKLKEKGHLPELIKTTYYDCIRTARDTCTTVGSVGLPEGKSIGCEISGGVPAI